MPDPASIETLRAACDTVAPATDGMPGALDLRSDEHAIDMLELGLPGITDMVAALLNAYASEVVLGTPFIELSHDDRSKVLRAMSNDESQDIRDAVDAIIVFTCGGMFSEWSGYDRAGGTLTAPPTWNAVGFPGPSHGHPNYREDI